MKMIMGLVDRVEELEVSKGWLKVIKVNMGLKRDNWGFLKQVF